MVSYYNHPAAASAMYRSQYHLNQAHHHPQTAAPPPPSHHQYHPHAANSMSWYPFNGGQTTGTPTYSNCMEEQPNLWNSSHSHPGPPPTHPPSQMFTDGVVDYQHHHHSNLHHHQQLIQQHQHQPAHVETQHHNHHDNQLPSPPITVSGSELSSPGAASGNVSPPNNHNNPLVLGVHQTRPPPVRSPFEWIKKTNYTTQPNPGKTRTKDKYRVVYTDHQRVELEKEFYYSRYITIRRKAELASNLGLSERQVKIWFQNRRAKERKQVKKREEYTGHGKDASSSSGIPIHPVQQHQPVLIHHHHHSASGSQPHLHPGSTGSGGSVSTGPQLSPVNVAVEQSSLNM